jgi:Protein of unknown function (DUF1573)
VRSSFSLLIYIGCAVVGLLAVNAINNGGRSAELRTECRNLGLGTVTAGELTEIVFDLENPGRNPIAIDTIATSCSCIKVNKGSLSLSPGERSQLVVTIDTSSMEGKFRFEVCCFTNTGTRLVGKLAGEIMVRPANSGEGNLSPFAP